jgi:metal-responsive CopG/Arc/MetJ family transcriptional regulator
MRRATNPTRKISITIPDRIFTELDRTLSYTQSRSRYISAAIEEKLEGGVTSISELTTRQLMVALCNRHDIDETMKALLLQLLAK